MSKKKGRSRSDLKKRAKGYQRQYKGHQQKVNENPESPALNHWMKEKANFLDRIHYYLSKAKMDEKEL